MNEPAGAVACDRPGGVPAQRETMTADERHLALKRVLGVVPGR